jgi:hypothetical protein
MTVPAARRAMASPPWPNGEMPSPAFGSSLSAAIRARCSGEWTRRISSSVASRVGIRTRWSTRPLTTTSSCSRRFVSAFSRCTNGCRPAAGSLGNSPADDDVSCQPKTSWYA